ncbi:MAG: polyamine ABC transporter substrate-binding protein [Beijerinckiaceae bacterium]
MMKRLLAAALLSFASLLPAAAQDKVVHVYNWSDYIDPKVLEDFTRETGIKVVYDVYDKNETVEAKLLAGKSGYDVVVPSATFLQRFIEQKLLQPIDSAKLPNLKNQWPQIQTSIAVYDPGNKFGVPYMWGTVGVGVNVKKVSEALGEAPPATWDVALDPKLVGKLKSCGVHILDAPEDVLPAALRWLKLDPNSKKADDIRKAAAALVKVRGNVRKFHSSEYINALANGDICMAVGYSGDVLQAKKRAEEAKNGVEIAYIIPREGAQVAIDSFAIPADAPHVAEAHAFIDFMMRPDIAARNVNVVAFASGNLAAKAEIKPEILRDRGVYPDEETFARLFTITTYDDRLQKVVTREWTRVMTGK